MIQRLFNGMLTLLLAEFMLNDVPHAAGLTNPGGGQFQQYCSKCGKVLGRSDVFYADLDEWKKEYREARTKGVPTPPLPESGYTKCCHAETIWPPAPELSPPTLAPSGERIESTDFGAMVRLCDAISKSPKSIKAYLRLDKVPSLFGPSVYFIDIKARRFIERSRVILEEEYREELMT